MTGLFNYDDPAAEVFRDSGAILADLDDCDWDVLLRCMERKVFAAGARILHTGERDRALYLVVSGSVRVVADSPKGPVVIASIHEGSVFGEMSFFDSEPRSANIYAQDEVQVLTLRAEKLDHLVAWHPRLAHKLLMDLGRVLSQRLRRASKGWVCG